MRGRCLCCGMSLSSLAPTVFPTPSIFPHPNHISIFFSSSPKATIFPSCRPSKQSTGSDNTSFMAFLTTLDHMATTMCMCHLHEMAQVRCGCPCMYQLGLLLWKKTVLVTTSSTFPMAQVCYQTVRQCGGL